MIVELYGGPADGMRCGVPDDWPYVTFWHVCGAPVSAPVPIRYERCPDDVPFEQIAAPDGTQRLMVKRLEPA